MFACSFIVFGSFDPFLYWVYSWKCLHSGYSSQDFASKSQLWGEICFHFQNRCWSCSETTCDGFHDSLQYFECHVSEDLSNKTSNIHFT